MIRRLFEGRGRFDVRPFTEVLGESYCGRFFGDAADVAEALPACAEDGADRISVLPLVEGTAKALAPALLDTPIST